MALSHVWRDAYFKKFRRHCIAEGEREHERAIAQYPVRVKLKFGPDLEANTREMVRIEHELAEIFLEGSFLAFPGTSVGKYKEDCYCLFFENKRDAVLARLSVDYASET